MCILIVIIGIVIGSFLNVCIYRIPNGQSIVYPSSRCPSCSAPLKWQNLIPIFSFLLQGGRCKYCEKEISPQYPITESLNGLLYIALYNKFGLSLDFIFYGIIFSVLIVIGFIDFKYMIIPPSLNILSLILGTAHKVLKNVIYGMPLEIINSLIALIIPSGIFLLTILVSKGGMGGGDMKLIGVLGFILGLKKIALAMFLSFIFGAIISLILLSLKIKSKKDPIPFAPFISLAFMITVLWGDQLILWYINLC